jgi:hypothetical protein
MFGPGCIGAGKRWGIPRYKVGFEIGREPPKKAHVESASISSASVLIGCFTLIFGIAAPHFVCFGEATLGGSTLMSTPEPSVGKD